MLGLVGILATSKGRGKSSPDRRGGIRRRTPSAQNSRRGSVGNALRGVPPGSGTPRRAFPTGGLNPLLRRDGPGESLPAPSREPHRYESLHLLAPSFGILYRTGPRRHEARPG